MASASTTFERAVKLTNWTPEEQVEILLEYTDNQQSPAAFADFIAESGVCE